MFDYFVAPLRCPSCGVISAPGTATNMQTHLRDDADGSALTVGSRLDPLDVRPDDILGSCYHLIRRPGPEEPLRLLDMWQCPACGRSDQWARIVIAGAEIRSIEAVALDRATLDSAHFISDQCEVLAAQLSDVPGIDLATGEVDCVEILRQRLP